LASRAVRPPAACSHWLVPVSRVNLCVS
jgi:hypothetical protein